LAELISFKKLKLAVFVSQSLIKRRIDFFYLADDINNLAKPVFKKQGQGIGK